MKGSGDDSGEIRTQRSALVQSTHIAFAWEKVLSILSYESRWERFGKWKCKQETTRRWKEVKGG